MSIDPNLLMAIEAGKPFTALVRDTSYQRVFRSAVSAGNPTLDAYMASDAIMTDIVNILSSSGLGTRGTYILSS
jgi:hypothetical protein